MNSNSVSALAGRVLKKFILFSLCFAIWGPVFARKMPAPKQTITGKVIDGSTGEALPGVNVLVEGTTVGTATNAEGKYSLEVTNTNAVLVFSYVGYTLQKISVAGKSVIDVKMEADLRKLEEVVVVGYGHFVHYVQSTERSPRDQRAPNASGTRRRGVCA